MRFASALVLILLAAPATAQQIQCSPEDYAPELLRKYGEHLMFQGVTAQGNLMELYSSARRRHMDNR